MREANDPTVAPAYEQITESMVLRALEEATIRQLAAALDPGAFRGDHGSDGFTCPECHRYTAEVIDEWRWCCSWCPRHVGTTVAGQLTRLALRRHVADRYDASLRLVQTVLSPRAVPSQPKRGVA